jgi:hypothetical protein
MSQVGSHAGRQEVAGWCLLLLHCCEGAGAGEEDAAAAGAAADAAATAAALATATSARSTIAGQGCCLLAWSQRLAAEVAAGEVSLLMRRWRGRDPLHAIDCLSKHRQSGAMPSD